MLSWLKVNSMVVCRYGVQMEGSARGKVECSHDDA